MNFSAESLGMLNRLPAWLPSWAELERDLGPHPAEAIGRALGVSASTVRRWRRTDAPTAARLAIWWLSRWGQDAWECEMFNRRQLRWLPAAAGAGFDGAIQPLSLARIGAREPGQRDDTIAPLVAQKVKGSRR